VAEPPRFSRHTLTRPTAQRRLDVVDCAADASERRLERLPGGGNAGVDERQPVIVFEQVEVGERVLDAVQSRRDVGVQRHADDPGDLDAATVMA
jgi:hypothetical protein